MPNIRPPLDIGPVVKPREVRYSATLAHSGSNGLSASRSLPTICNFMCSVARVSFHASYGSSGQSCSGMHALQRTARRGSRRNVERRNIRSEIHAFADGIVIPHGKEGGVGLAKRAVQRHYLEGALHHRQLLIV